MSGSNPFSDPPSSTSKNSQIMPSKTTDLSEAVRDTVTVRGVRMGRSNTATPAPPPKAPHLGPRSQSQDSSPEKQPRSATKSKKKGSQHADVIDRLDFTGVGPMFHHDGPFDACAPSRNRHRNKAPMMAWSKDPAGPNQFASDSPYPSSNGNAYQGFSDSHYDPPKKKVDAIAEAWGIHEPEPYEEFFAGGGARGDTPASSIYNGKDSHSSTPKSSKRTTKDGRDAREVYRDYLEDSSYSRSRPTRRGGIPPPQPIFVPDPTTPPTTDQPVIGTSPGSPGLPKRSKSLMHRIRKMRDAPNVPVGSDYEDSPSSPNFPPRSSPPVSAQEFRERPTHKSNNSFLGRFGTARANEPALSEPFIFISPTNGATNTEKDLPAPPMTSTTPKETSSNSGYFDYNSSPNGNGLGRKTSIIKKVGRVVRGKT